MKNVKTLLIFATISTLVFAGNTRIAALGGNAGHWADDYANIGTFPASVNDHTVAYTTGSNFTSIWNDGNGTTWGVTAGTGHQVADIAWGNGTYGVTFGLGMTPENLTSGAPAENNLDIGFGMPLSGMDFGFITNTKDHQINLRRAQDLWVWDNMLVNVNIYEAASNASGGNAMSFGASFYSNRAYGAGTSGLFAMGLDYGDQDGGDANMDLSWTFAVESAMTDWATVRIGYSHSYDLMNQATADGVADAATIGLGFNYGSFNLDMELNAATDLFNDPIVYMTGRNTGHTLGANWEISYVW